MTPEQAIIQAILSLRYVICVGLFLQIAVMTPSDVHGEAAVVTGYNASATSIEQIRAQLRELSTQQPSFIYKQTGSRAVLELAPTTGRSPETTVNQPAVIVVTQIRRNLAKERELQAQIRKLQAQLSNATQAQRDLQQSASHHLRYADDTAANLRGKLVASDQLRGQLWLVIAALCLALVTVFSRRLALGLVLTVAVMPALPLVAFHALVFAGVSLALVAIITSVSILFYKLETWEPVTNEPSEEAPVTATPRDLQSCHTGTNSNIRRSATGATGATDSIGSDRGASGRSPARKSRQDHRGTERHHTADARIWTNGSSQCPKRMGLGASTACGDRPTHRGHARIAECTSEKHVGTSPRHCPHRMVYPRGCGLPVAGIGHSGPTRIDPTDRPN